MKVIITYTDRETRAAEKMLSASKEILKAVKVKYTPPRDGYKHIYVASRSAEST